MRFLKSRGRHGAQPCAASGKTAVGKGKFLRLRSPPPELHPSQVHPAGQAHAPLTHAHAAQKLRVPIHSSQVHPTARSELYSPCDRQRQTTVNPFRSTVTSPFWEKGTAPFFPRLLSLIAIPSVASATCFLRGTGFRACSERVRAPRRTNRSNGACNNRAPLGLLTSFPHPPALRNPLACSHCGTTPPAPPAATPPGL